MEDVDGQNIRVGHEYDDEILNYQEASAHTKIKMATLYALVCQGRVPHMRISPRMVRFRKSELDKWLSKNEIRNADIQ